MKTLMVFKAVVFVITLFFFVFTSGCNKDDTIMGTPQVEDVNGILCDANGEPIGNVNIELLLYQGFDVTKTLPDGSFHFSKVIFPYTINITGNNDNSLQSTAYVFNGLTTINPYIRLRSIEQNFLQRSAIIHLQTPDTNNPSGRNYIVAVYDSTGIIMSRLSVPLVFDGDLYIYWTGRKETYNANIFIISFDYNKDNEKFFFYKYSEKQILISNGSQSSVNFTFEDLNFVNESNETGCHFPSGWTMNYVSFGFTFNNLLSSYYRGIYVNNPPGSQTLSVYLPIIYNKRLYYYYSIDAFSTSNYSSYHWNNSTIPGANIYLKCKSIPILANPFNNADNVSAGTIFKINDADNSGIYLFELKCDKPFNLIRLYTKNLSFKFPEIKDTSFIFRKKSSYWWNVSKYYNINSIDDITSKTNEGNYITSEYSITGYNYFNTIDTLK